MRRNTNECALFNSGNLSSIPALCAQAVQTFVRPLSVTVIGREGFQKATVHGSQQSKNMAKEEKDSSILGLMRKEK